MKAGEKHQSLDISDSKMTLTMTSYRQVQSNINFYLNPGRNYTIYTGFKIFNSTYDVDRIDAADSPAMPIMWAHALRLASGAAVFAALALF